MLLRKGMFIADRYEVVSLIGKGGMADVYKGMDHKLNRYVAIKILKEEYRNDRSFVSKFRAEAQAAARLAHPNVVNVYDVGDEEGINYIIMELVEGITLKNYIERKGKLTVRETTSIAIQVALGIEAAHNLNIVHRDIKPQNIMISREGKVKVTDFGIAKVASSGTVNSITMGSVHYTSPEQARGGYSDAKSDIYALGIVMYEMITGRVPFDGETTVSVAVKHLQEEIVKPSVYAQDVTVSLEDIILKCTQKGQDRRYANTGELLKDLKQSLVTPNASFVTFVTADEKAKTRVLTSGELDKIKQESGQGRQPLYVEDDYEDDEYEDDDYEYDDYEDDEYEDDDYEDDDYDEEEEDDRFGVIPLRRRRRDEDEYDDDEYDDGDELNPNLEKIMFIGGIVVAVIIFLIIIFLLGRAFGIFKFGGKKPEEVPEQEQVGEVIDETEEIKYVEVPRLVGETYEKAQDQLSAIGLLINATYEESDEFEEGQIMSQSLKEGEEVEEGTTVDVVVCSGKESFELPSLIDKKQSAAEDALEELGLECLVEQAYSDTVDEGRVIKTNPAQGSLVMEGQKVTIVISKGREIKKAKVPKVTEMLEADAKAALINAGFKVGTVSEDYSDTIAAGRVVTQSEAAGTEVEIGKTIDITLSKGKQPVRVPDVYNLRFEEAVEELEDAGFIAVEGESAFDNNVAEGCVISQNVTGKAVPGTTIKLKISLGPEETEEEAGGGTENTGNTESTTQTDPQDVE